MMALGFSLCIRDGNARRCQLRVADARLAGGSARWPTLAPVRFMPAFQREVIAKEASACRAALTEAGHVSYERLGGFLLGFLPFVLLDRFGMVDQALLRVRVDQERIKAVDHLSAQTDRLTCRRIQCYPSIAMIALGIIVPRNREERRVKIHWRGLALLGRIESQNLRGWLSRRIVHNHAVECIA